MLGLIIFWIVVAAIATPIIIINENKRKANKKKKPTGHINPPENYSDNLGKQCIKNKSNKPFKSGNKINTIKGIMIHPILDIPAYTFYEDDSFVECRRVKTIN